MVHYLVCCNPIAHSPDPRRKFFAGCPWEAELRVFLLYKILGRSSLLPHPTLLLTLISKMLIRSTKLKCAFHVANDISEDGQE